MRQYFTSDLHFGVDPLGDRAVRSLADHVNRVGRPDDTLLIGGDVADGLENLHSCLALFNDFPGQRLAIAGNHDIWVNPGMSSWTRYRELTALFQAGGFRPLEDEPTVIGGLGFVGSLGWYDGSFRDAAIGISDESYRAKTYPGKSGVLWGDALGANWGMPDEDFAAWQDDRLERHLRSLSGVREIVVLTHHVPTKRLLLHPRCLVPREWRFLNAFLGSERFARTISRHADQVKLAVCGHIHLARTTRIDGVSYVSLGGDYASKQLLIRDRSRLTRVMF